MEFDVYKIIFWLTAAFMLYALYRIIALRIKVRGGSLKNRVNQLAGLAVLVGAGYVAVPMLPPESAVPIMNILFLLVAVFIVIVAELMSTIMTELGIK